MGSVGTREGQVGYFWQRANYYWHLTKCCRTTGGFLQDDLEVLAGCQCGWQSAKFDKSPRPKHRATARCMGLLSMYITYISVSVTTPLAVTGPIDSCRVLLFLRKLPAILQPNRSHFKRRHHCQVEYSALIHHPVPQFLSVNLLSYKLYALLVA